MVLSQGKTIEARKILLFLGLIMVFGALLRTLALHRESVDQDELFSRSVALMPAHEEFEAIRYDLVHPPLYYYLLKGDTLVLGTSVLAVRTLSLVFGVLSIGLVGYIGYQLPGARYTGLLAAGLLAVNRYHIYFSQQARSYALYTFLVLLLVLWIQRIYENPASKALWVGGAALMTVLVYTHYIGAIYVIGAVLTLLLSRASRSTKVGALVAGGCAALCFVPWMVLERSIYVEKHGLGENLSWIGHPTLYGLRVVLIDSLGLLNVPMASTLELLVIAGLVAAGLIVVSRESGLRENPVVTGLLVLALLPPLTLFVLSVRPFNLTLFILRQVLPSLVLLSLLCAYGLDRAYGMTRSRVLLYGGVTVLLCMTVVPTAEAFRAGTARLPYYAVEKKVMVYSHEGDAVYAGNYEEGETVNFYANCTCVKNLPANVSHLPHQIIFLYRPMSGQESAEHRALVAVGYADRAKDYFAPGQYPDRGVDVDEMIRR